MGGRVPMQLSQPDSEYASTALQGDDLPSEQAQGAQAHVTVQVAVDGYTHSLPIYAGDDWEAEAERFCTKSQIAGKACVENILAEISTLWKAAEADAVKAELQFESTD